MKDAPEAQTTPVTATSHNVDPDRCKAGQTTEPTACTWHNPHHWCKECQGWYGVPHDYDHDKHMAEPSFFNNHCACRGHEKQRKQREHARIAAAESIVERVLHEHYDLTDRSTHEGCFCGEQGPGSWGSHVAGLIVAALTVATTEGTTP